LTSSIVAAQESSDRPAQVWEMQLSSTDVSLRGLSVVSEQVAWASGQNGVIIRTVDAGANWDRVDVPDQSSLDFRDLHAFDEMCCVVISAGSPGVVFRTEDGGKNWIEVYRNDSPTIFFDAISFWDEQRGLAFSDPQDGRFFLIGTTDGGKTWKESDEAHRPETHPGEAAFAASGTSIAVMDDGLVWIATGGEHGPNNEPSARVFSTEDGGLNWSVFVTPLASNESSGIFSIAFANIDHGVAVGGNYQLPDQADGNVALTDDSGRTWRLPTGNRPAGYRSAVAVLNLDYQSNFVAVGPTGTDLSTDWGNSWRAVDQGSFHAVAFTADGKAGWAVGEKGRVAKWIGNDTVRAQRQSE
jgi:photosystem II stability/assembly factor-like uncharacterized protein